MCLSTLNFRAVKAFRNPIRLPAPIGDSENQARAIYVVFNGEAGRVRGRVTKAESWRRMQGLILRSGTEIRTEGKPCQDVIPGAIFLFGSRPNMVFWIVVPLLTLLGNQYTPRSTAYMSKGGPIQCPSYVSSLLPPFV